MKWTGKTRLYVLAAVIVAGGALWYSGLLAKVRAMTSKLGAHWSNLNPEMQRRADAVITSLAAQGITVGIPWDGGWRSIADQEGIPKSNTRVEDPRDSYHVWGLAVDFVPLDASGAFNWPPNTDPVWQKIGAAIRAQGLTWGGDWTGFKDMPHGELKLDTLASLKANYPDPMDYVNANSGAMTA